MNPGRKSSSSRSSQHRDAPSGMVIDYGQIWRLCQKYWKWLAAAVVLGAVIGLLVALAQRSIYASRSSIVVAATHTSNDPSLGANPLVASNNDSTMKTVEQLLQTRDLFERVVREAKLTENADFLPPGAPIPASEDYAVAVLTNDTDIRNWPPSTRIIQITVEHHFPEIAKMLADKLANAAVVQASEQISSGNNLLADSLQKDVDDLAAKSAAAEAKLIEYERANHISDATIDPDNTLVATGQKDLYQDYVRAKADLALLSDRYGPNHPKLIQARQRVDELQQQLNKAGREVLNQDSTSIDFNTLKSAADSLKAQQANMLKALQEARTSVSVTDPGIRLADPADLPLAPVRPSKTKNVAIGAFAGFFCGACFVLGVYFLDPSIRTVSQAESTLDVPVIAAVPILSDSDSKSKLPTFSDPQSFVAESFRGLRASLLLHDREHPLRIVLVGSAIPGEGKSFCAANLAVAFAQAGLKTLLIDADLRLPTAYQYFNVPEGDQAGGFPAVLEGKATLESAIIKSPVPTLHLLTTTRPAESPAELLSTSRLYELLEQAAARYDRIVIDSAPLNAVSDTMLIVQKADAILLVVRAGSTPASETKSALQKLSGTKLKPLGIILNYLAPHTLKSYSYGYSYGQKPPQGKNGK